MAKQLTYEIVTDASKGIAGLKQFSSAVKKSMKDVETSSEGASTSAQKVAKALTAVASDIEKEMKGAAKAAEALGNALGPEISGRADLDSIVVDLRKMGLSFEEITTDADQLAVALRELDRVQIDAGGLDRMSDSARRAKSEVDDIGRSAGSSRSVLANMVGNATQDLGALSGIAGSAGVAIGQMGEYMADAAGDGDSLGQIVGNFSKVLGPIAALSVGIGLVTKVMGDISKRNKEVAETTKEVAAAVAESFDAIDNLTDVGGDITSVFDQIGLAFITAEETSGRALAALSDLGIGASQLGSTLAELDQSDAGRFEFIRRFIEGSEGYAGASDQIVDATTRAILSGEDFGQVLEFIETNMQNASAADQQMAENLAKNNRTRIESLEQLKDSAEDFDLEGTVQDITDALLRSTGGLEAWNQAWAEAGPDATDLEVLKRAFEIYNAMPKAAQRWAKANKPLEDMPETWRRAGAAAMALLDGQELNAQQTQALTTLMRSYGMTQDEVLTQGRQLWDEHAAAQEQAVDDMEQGVVDWANATIEAFTNVLTAQRELAELADPFAQMGIAEEAIGAAFDLGNAPAELTSDMFDIQDELRDFVEFVNDDLKGVIPDIFNPDDIHSGEFLNKIEGLRGPIQERVAGVFASEGPEAALALGQSFISQLEQTFGSAFPPGFAEQLLFPGGLQARIDIGVDEKSLINAQRQLELLTRIGGGTDAWTAAIELALQAGTLTPESATILIQRRLKDLQVPIPTALLEPDTGAAKEGADAFALENPVNMGTTVEKPSDVELGNARIYGQNYATRNPINWPVIISDPTKRLPLTPLSGRFDTGGTVGSGGGIVGERRPEIINERYLVTGPTVVPAGTRVTSGQRTARILRNGGGRRLRRYDAGGVVAAGPQTLNINVRAGIIGDRYAIMRAVRRAGRDEARLMGTRV